MKIYANEHDYVFPPSFREVLATQEITSDVFVCPASTTETPAAAPRQGESVSPENKLKAAAALVDPNGRRCSYIYAGGGLRDDTSEENILAFEAQPHRGLNGFHFNVLFGDGHVDALNIYDDKLSSAGAIQYQNLMANFAAGVRPLRLRP